MSVTAAGVARRRLDQADHRRVLLLAEVDRQRAPL
jgi:hypothetical protein